MDRVMQDGAFPFLKLQIEAHFLKDGQKIRENDGRVHAEFFHGREHDLGAKVRVSAKIQKRPALPNGPVLRHVAARLTHHPDRRAIDRLAAQRFHHSALEAGFHGRVPGGEKTFKIIPFSNYTIRPRVRKYPPLKIPGH